MLSPAAWERRRNSADLSDSALSDRRRPVGRSARDPGGNILPLVFFGCAFSYFQKPLWPASLPKFSHRSARGHGDGDLRTVFAETFGTQYGMGYFIMDAWLRGQLLEMYAGIGIEPHGAFPWLFDVIELISRRWQKDSAPSLKNEGQC